MPNWCETTLEIYGTKEEITRFINGIHRDGEGLSILQSYHPCPQELTDTTSGFFSDADKQEEHNEVCEANIAKYGYSDWYAWQNANWGTKWGDCDTTLEEQYIYADTHYAKFVYRTAWSPATEGFIYISKMFPTLFFVFEHDEEAGFFAGMEVIHNGEVVFVELYEPCSYDGNIDWDDMETIDAYEEWKLEHMDTIHANYARYMKSHYPTVSIV